MCAKLISCIFFSKMLIDTTWKHLENYAERGLRTLLFCEKQLDKKEYQEWARKYHEATTSIEGREEKMESVQELIETDMELTGATAIEDKLQDDVGFTIAILKEAGIKVWVLTGDKIETAINIAFACKLITSDLEQIIIDSKKEEEVNQRIDEEKKRVIISNAMPYFFR